MTRQSVPDEAGGRWRVQFGIPNGAGELRYVFSARTPPCPGGDKTTVTGRCALRLVEPPALAEAPAGAEPPGPPGGGHGRKGVPRESEQVRLESMGFVLALVEGATSRRPPEGMSAEEALRAYAAVIEVAAREHFGPVWDVFVVGMRRARAEEPVH